METIILTNGDMIYHAPGTRLKTQGLGFRASKIQGSIMSPQTLNTDPRRSNRHHALLDHLGTRLHNVLGDRTDWIARVERTAWT